MVYLLVEYNHTFNGHNIVWVVVYAVVAVAVVNFPFAVVTVSVAVAVMFCSIHIKQVGR